MTYLTHYFAAFVGVLVGWFIAAALIGGSLRDEWHDLDLLRERYMRALRALRPDPTPAPDKHAVLKASLISAHLDHATNGKGWIS